MLGDGQAPLPRCGNEAEERPGPQEGKALALGLKPYKTDKFNMMPGGVRALLPPACPRVPWEGGQGDDSSGASLQIYPDESHYFHSAALQQHLYGAITNFFVECFRVQDKLPATAAKEEEEED